MKLKANARVQVTMIVEAKSVWSDDASFDQVFSQAKREVIERIVGLRSESGHGNGISIVGEPTVSVVLVEKTP